ncbi:MAG: hypothetical protein AB7O66_12540 [Limisphaerales bacterium]
MRIVRFSAGAACLLAAGCASSTSSPSGQEPGRERGPDGTVAYLIDVEASEPDVRIEVNGEDLGMAPLQVKVFGDKDGTFHNFGGFNYVIRAIPTQAGQYPQTKTFHTGGFFTQEDRIPKRVHFQMNMPTVP